MSPTTTVYFGPAINPVSLTEYSALPNCLIAVSSHGIIDWLEKDVDATNLQNILLKHGYEPDSVVELLPGQFLMPGLIDTHIHAPQVPNIGTGQQYELLDWLANITFPMESKFADADLAERVYRSVVKRVLNSGTTTACYYATLHVEASQILANVVHAAGQRAFIGKCNMNRNSPDSYREPSAEDSVEATKVLIKYIHSLSSPLVHPIITPRFAISCTDELLKSLGHLAASHPTMAIQTHISENKAEVAFTKELFPDRTSYADVYDHFGLLRDTTVLAHAVHLEDDEKKLIKQRNAGISHCPDSNFNLSSGVAPVGEFLDLGIKVGLGTDVSGGTSVSILRAVQMASVAAKTKAMQQPTPVTSGFANRALSIATLLYLATLGGAEVCCLDKVIGSFEQGKQFDALVVDIRDRFGGNPGLWGENLLDGLTEKQQLETSLERFLFCGDDRNIRRVFVKGKCVAGFAKD